MLFFIAYGTKKLTRWYDLLNEDEVYDRDNILGEIELTVQWYSDPSAGELAKWQQGWFEALRRKISKSCLWITAKIVVPC